MSLKLPQPLYLWEANPSFRFKHPAVVFSNWQVFWPTKTVINDQVVGKGESSWSLTEMLYALWCTVCIIFRVSKKKM